MSDEPELFHGVVLRFGTAKARFSTDGKGVQAMPSDFRLSSADRDVPTGRDPSLSVWDRERTTPHQVKTFMDETRSRPVFGLAVERVRLLRYPKRQPLRVVRDLESVADKLSLPGADGHCGIVGLKRPSGVDKRHRRALESRLADLAYNVEAPAEERLGR